VRGTKRVLTSITQAAIANRSLPLAGAEGDAKKIQLRGDALCDHLVRHAAGVADTLPDDVAPSALLLALASGLDDTDGRLAIADAGGLTQAIESPMDRGIRVMSLGEPTLLGRRDLARRFFIAAYLSAAIGRDAAEEACLNRELAAGKMGSFSFAQVMADRAGIRWGEDVGRRRFKLQLIASSFAGTGLMPPVDGVPADLLPAQFTAQFGSAGDSRFRVQLAKVDEQIKALPLYGGR
jgi:hypothetical protein